MHVINIHMIWNSHIVARSHNGVQEDVHKDISSDEQVKSTEVRTDELNAQTHTLYNHQLGWATINHISKTKWARNLRLVVDFSYWREPSNHVKKVDLWTIFDRVISNICKSVQQDILPFHIKLLQKRVWFGIWRWKLYTISCKVVL